MSVKKSLIVLATAASCVFLYETVRGQGPGAGGQGFGGGPGGGGNGMGLRKPGMNMENFDANQDNQVTLDEFLEAHKKILTQRFNIMDKNQDNVLTADELEAADRHIQQGFNAPRGNGERPPFRQDFAPNQNNAESAP